MPTARLQELQAIDSDGAPIGEPTRRRSSWLDLQAHASQPASTTVIDEVDLALPSGTEDCWRYTVRSGDEHTVFWFAKARAGPPVQVEERVRGTLVLRWIVIEDRVA